MLSLCFLCDVAYYVFVKEPAIAMHFALRYVVLVAISMMVVKIMLAVCILVGRVVCAKADSASSVNFVQSAFL